ncbi:hypothetical protein [Brachybacterium sp. NPDC056505]|uniref:hypothetical protein n=1 Tax=Brachybacterium sp. NPDC056505 TaxID=3345843 RepID=UPI003672E353
MSWFKVDDKIHAHPKFKRIPRALRLAASGLWVHAGAWSAAFETDGAVPEYIVEDLGGTDVLVEALVAVGLWDPADDGIQFHDWDEFQPTKAAKDEKRAAEAERVRKWRQRKSRESANGQESGTSDGGPVRSDGSSDRTVQPENGSEVSGTSGNGNAVRAHGVTDAYASPGPSRPDPTPTTTPVVPTGAQGELLQSPPPAAAPRRGAVYPDAFEAWWKVWPKPGDTKRTAFTAWEKATKGNTRQRARVTPEHLQAAVGAYAADPNLPDPQYMPAAATWLNQDRWENGPLPARNGGQPSGGRPDALRQGLDTVARLKAQSLQSQNPTPPALTRRTA